MNSLLVFEDFLLAKELQGVSPNTLLRYHYSIVVPLNFCTSRLSETRSA